MQARGPAFPADVVGLVVEVEDDAAVVAVFGGDAAPEVGRVFGVGQRQQAGREAVARRRPVQVEDHVEAGALERRRRIRGSPPGRRAPLRLGSTPLIPSQQLSFSGTRTALMCQLFIALIEAQSVGPSKIRALFDAARTRRRSG